MIKIAIGFLLGCLLCLNLSELPAAGWLLALLLAPLIWFRQLLLSSLIVGLLWSGVQAHLRLTDQLPETLAGQTILTQGRIASVPEQHDHLVRFIFEPENPELPDKIRLSWYHPPEQIPTAGERWQLGLRLKPPRGLSNPGSFDYEKWLFAENIGATGYVHNRSDNKRSAAAPPLHVDNLRQQIQQTLATLLPAAHQPALVQGLAVGLRDNLSQQHWTVLRQTGTSHLLAISGLHIGLAATLGFFLFRWGWSLSTSALHRIPAKQIGAIGGLLFALFYALLAGMSIPTQRALIMVTTVMVALLLRRTAYPSQLFALSLFAVLVFDPLSVLNAGFWLSFSAVALILLTCSGRFPSAKRSWLWIHLWLALGLMPLLLLFFGEFSLIAPLANLVAVPVVSLLVVPLILLTMLLLPLSQSLAGLAFWLADQLLHYLWLWLSWLAELPIAHWQLHHLPDVILVIMAALWLLLLLPRGMPGRWLSLMGLLPLFLYLPNRPAHGQFFFTLLDVGQGLSAVIQTEHHTLVFDTGPRHSERFDTGSSVVAPYLLSQGITSIDSLIVSHGDNDHRGGVEGLLETLPAKQILTSENTTLPQAQLCQAGQHWRWDGVDFTILQPSAGQQGSKNNRSCVLKVTSTELRLLLPGDIEQVAEQQLLGSYGAELDADILVVPHHGSRTSSTGAFIDVVSPAYALFPVGYRNRYGFPKDDVVQRYQDREITLLRTDRHGALIFDSKNPPIRWRQHSSHLWHNSSTE